MKEFKFASSSSAAVYTTRVHDDGTVSCDCKGWTVKRLNRPRMCKHTVEVSKNLGLPAQATAAEPSATPLKKAVKGAAAKGGFIDPMLASAMPSGKTAADFDPAEFVMEEKFDGHRLVVRVEGGAARAWSRLGNERALPARIAAAVAGMPDGVYDGELIVPSSQHSYSVTDGRSAGSEAIVLFDMVEVGGASIAREPLATRVEFLKAAYRAVRDRSAVLKAPQFPPSAAVVEAIWGRGGEGAIIKRRSSPYRPGWRSPDWVKVKAAAAATLTIIGFEAGKNGPHSAAVLRGADGVETTVKTLDGRTLREIARDPGSWIGRRLVISYQERLPSGKYRHPMWDHPAGPGE